MPMKIPTEVKRRTCAAEKHFSAETIVLSSYTYYIIWYEELNQAWYLNLFVCNVVRPPFNTL